MSVDLEEYFSDLHHSTWDNYESRLEKTAKILLELFDKYKITATFFTLGYVAEKHPELIEKIISKGHEIASHGYWHNNIKQMTAETFEDDLLKSFSSIEKISKEKVIGFRAPWFSVDRKNNWVFEIMKKHLKYDSSIFPVKFHYQFGDAPRYIYKMSDEGPLKESKDGKLIEIPMATIRFPVYGNFPIAGGIYLRFLPVWLVKYGIKKLNKEGFPAMTYIHLQDLDPEKPRLDGIPWYEYIGLKNSRKKMESILRDFTFSSAREVLDSS